MKNIKYIFYFNILFLFSNCSRSEDCVYVSQDCSTFTYTENFETATLNNVNGWTTINGTGIVANFPVGNTNKAMKFTDGSGVSTTFNSNFLTANLIATGCDIYYKVALNAVGDATAENAMELYNTTNFYNSTYRAVFKLKDPYKIVANKGVFTSIKIPIALASNNVLPSNEYGQWTIVPSVNAADDAQKFNDVLKNRGGVSFTVDVPNAENVVWYYDDFQIKTCCSTF
ncbi:hypothetical protein [Frigoriflavimonas asaccharolytica]|uniref:Uncharacterized protein n=1 Tax=Frigoriflavimonas asaccharolytica TaxID=2735899 RepID=A0A8J8G5N5_9FLAO|nr:hypothetical protein [Frigoriflavimonas asaccharolytica]NRS91506.1 hypothetical protein [Frigoriflavimonas asaccharolytica]